MVPRGYWCIFALVGLALVQPSHSYYQGRHVCTERKKIQHPVPVTHSYRRAVYKKALGKVVYVTAHRTTFRMEMKTHLYRSCCKGWSKRVAREAGCLAPVCKEKCLNGGHCIAPGLCRCSEGYAGYRCQTEINECSGRHQCQQKCINLPGTYECACQKGFVLADDEFSCDLCLSCTPEFKKMESTIGALGQQIASLKREKRSLKTNITVALHQFETALTKMDEMHSRVQAQVLVTSPPPVPAASSTLEPDYTFKDKAMMPLDRLASLSQQISILEERMADCACNGPDAWY